MECSVIIASALSKDRANLNTHKRSLTKVYATDTNAGKYLIEGARIYFTI